MTGSTKFHSVLTKSSQFQSHRWPNLARITKLASNHGRILKGQNPPRWNILKRKISQILTKVQCGERPWQVNTHPFQSRKWTTAQTAPLSLFLLPQRFPLDLDIKTLNHHITHYTITINPHVIASQHAEFRTPNRNLTTTFPDLFN
jgi:hypothetical protein